MAKVNRYTQLTPAKYNPLSLEEIMMVPLIKRKQHDDLLNGIAETREGLAQVNPLDIHSPMVVAEQERLEKMLQQQADEAAQHGISGKLRGDFINMNAAYQKAMGPEGVLGKADAIRAKYEKDKAEILANAVQLGHNPSKTMENLDKWYANYAANHDGKTLEELNMPLPPNYRRLQDLLAEVKPLLGSTIKTDRGDETYDIVPDPETGALVFKTQSGQIITESNDKQLNQALELIKADLDGEWGASNEWNHVSKDQAIRQLNAGIEMMRTSKVQDTRQDQYQVLSDMNAKANAALGNAVEKWVSFGTYLRDGDDGGNPLMKNMEKNPYYQFIGDKLGLLGTTFEDTRPEDQRGANYRNDGSHQITGEVLEQIIMDERYRHLDDTEVGAGVRGSGIFDTLSGDDLVIEPTIKGDRLKIQGRYNGKNYSLVIDDKQVTDIYRRYGTSEEGRRKFSEGVKQRRNYISAIREADPIGMSNFTDKQIADMYNKVIQDNSVYMQTTWKPLNVNNTYYKSTSEGILGKPGSGNLGSILTSKVRIFREDGSDIISLNGKEGMSYLANELMNISGLFEGDGEFNDMEKKDQRDEFFHKIQNATNHGVTVGDHEFVNEHNFSVTDKNGGTIFFKVENNNQLSGKDGTMTGIDDASQAQKYLIEGKPFVKSEGEYMVDEYKNTVKIDKYFAHIPYMGQNGFTIKPVVIRTRGGINFTSVADIAKYVNPTDLSVPEGLEKYIMVEDMGEVNARVSAELAEFYNTTPGDGITNKEAQENYGY